MIGTRLMSGSLAISLTKRSIAATPSIMPSSMLMSMTCAPFSTCWRATDSAAVVVAVADQVAELRRAGDVGALADVDEQRVGVIVSGSRPGQPAGRRRRRRDARRQPVDRGRDRRDVLGRRAAAAAEQVDQPALGELADDRGGLVRRLVVLAEGVGQAGVRDSRRRSSRRPGRARRGRAASRPRRARSSGRPAAGVAWRTEFQNASVTCPDSVRPEASVIVPEIITGQRRPRCSNSVSTAKIAALALSVSKIVSISSRSAPPSTSPLSLFEVGLDQLVVGDVAGARVVDVGRDRRGAVGRAERAGDEAGPARVGRGHRVALGPGQPGRLDVELVGELGMP